MRSSRLVSRSISFVTALSLVSLVLARPALADAAPPSTGTVASPPPAPIEVHPVLQPVRHGFVIAPMPVQNGVVLAGSDLYRALGRPDLAQSYDHRMAAKLALVGASFASLVAGGVLMGANMPHRECAFGAQPDPFTLPPLECHTAGGGAPFDVGVGLVALVPLFLGVGALMSAEPIDAAERARLISEHNASSSPRPVSLNVAPTVSPEGGGLSLSARF
jgi:hypothetical protein